jgi:hypothetical protein
MFNAFQKIPTLTDYTPLLPKIDLQATNTKKSAFWFESGQMNFAVYDLAPEDELNRILWAQARPGETYPAAIHRAIFTQPIQPKPSDSAR